MLESIDNDLWHAVHAFRANGLPVTTRMTVVRLPGRRLLVHSPIPADRELRSQLDELGNVAFIVAPNLMHHLFLAPFAAAFPQAVVFGPPGLRRKRPDLGAIEPLPEAACAAWQPELEHFGFEGIPAGDESVWFHRPSATLIVTDLVQWMRGPLAWPTRAYAVLTGVSRAPAVPLTVRALVRDRAAAERSARRLLQWPFARVLLAHDAIITRDAHACLARALSVLQRRS